MVNLSNITGKLAGKADMIGKLAGFMLPMKAMSDASGRDILSETFNQLTTAATTLDFQRVIDKGLYHLTEGVAKPAFDLSLAAIIGGELASAFGFGKAAAIKKFGWSTLTYAAISTAVILAGCPEDDAALAQAGTQRIYNKSVVAPNQGYSY